MYLAKCKVSVTNELGIGGYNNIDVNITGIQEQYKLNMNIITEKKLHVSQTQYSFNVKQRKMRKERKSAV